MNIRDFEETVLEIEEVTIRVRARTDTQVEDYDYDRRAADNMSVTNWLRGRISPCLDGLEVSVIDGNYQTPHGRTNMGTLRQSYVR